MISVSLAPTCQPCLNLPLDLTLPAWAKAATVFVFCLCVCHTRIAPSWIHPLRGLKSKLLSSKRIHILFRQWKSTAMDGHLPSLGWSLTNRKCTTDLNLAHILNSQNYSQVTTTMDGHLPSLGWSPTNPGLVTHQTWILALRLNSQN